MVTIAFCFPAGRYHATPWGRHVNEAEIEWPPSPWRILRALVATWHRKGASDRYPTAVLDGLVERLSSNLPSYRLPCGVRTHSRHYMPQGRLKTGREDTSLIFDAFLRLDPQAELIANWPHTILEPEQYALLDELTRDLGFLGRAESWVEAWRIESWEGEANCHPSEISMDIDTGEMLEPVRLMTPRPAEEYATWRNSMIRQHGLDAKKLKKPQRAILSTLPERFIDTLRLETSDLQQAGWSLPPGTRAVIYQRPSGNFTQDSALRFTKPNRVQTTTARLALAGRPLPRLEDAIKIGELARVAAIKNAEKANGGYVPAVLSGHHLPVDNRHGHAFYLPEDADRDGYIDHILVHAPAGISAEGIRALDRITRLWERDGGEWQILYEGSGTVKDLPQSPYLGRARIWTSVTPYLHPWHIKKNFGVAEQIARECRQRELPEPVEVKKVERIIVGGKKRRPVHFHRFRSTHKRLTQPDTRGHFVQIIFAKPVDGPLALGFGCHYGLGVFSPGDEKE
ncbi:CRISPR-associated protein Csb2 [Ectothiorhodospira mobilis]|uniref:CRISPR-associated protein Csb2 n=1 Tax=Ectothiorhodospira mobilis TaxID=195064 RepID=A0A1I4S0N6_ECTMO|nr:type I-U CRISPR-associated protein Csb2 [Ectothiorhodospira mobilis]SFM58092.1 CRISPR-associated protein Csb2 [Ectothiorhodospira mobilis]